MKNKAIIHIGAHKTGSTSIQKILFDNAQELIRYNIYYPVELTNPKINFFGQHSLAWCLLGREAGPFGVSSQEIKASRSKLSGMPNDKDLILSSEDFSLLELDSIQALREDLDAFDVTVIMYIRRQDESVQALYQTDVVSLGQTTPVMEWYNCRKYLFDYCAIADRWAKIFDQKIIVKTYEKRHLANKNVIEDFHALMEQVFIKRIEIPKLKYFNSYDLNRSLPDSITRIIRYYNTQSLKDSVVTVLKKLGSQMTSPKCARFQLLSPSERRYVLNDFNENNRILEEKYLLKNDERLFETTIEQTDEEWKSLYTRQGHDIIGLANDCLFTIENLKRKTNPTTNDKRIEKRLEVPAEWQAETAYKNFQNIACSFSDDEWIEVIGRSCENPIKVKGFPFPTAPEADIQTQFVGSFGKECIQEAGKFYKYVLEIIKREELKKISTLLDFGCGWGRFTRLFHRNVQDGGLYGVDPWGYAINLCKTHYPFGTFIKSDFLPPLPFRDNFFDIVVSYSVFSHLIEHAAKAWILEISRILKPGGILFGTTHGKWLFDNIDSIRRKKRVPLNFWEKSISKNWPDIELLNKSYNQGEFIFIANKNHHLPIEIYGNAFIPEKYVRDRYQQQFEIIEYLSDQARVSQAVFVLRKKN